MKIFLIIGTRPEAVKVAPVYKKLRQDKDFQAVVVATAQHRQMLDQVFAWFDIQPDHDLDLMRPDQGLSDVLVGAVSGLDKLIQAEAPDAILAEGDTTTVLAAALAAFHRHVPFGHIEAGLRTGDLTAPYPEEANRAMVARIATWHFAPTARAVEALRREHVGGSIFLTGNTVIDALLETAARVDSRPAQFTRDRLVLITGHRRENFGGRFEDAFSALGVLADRFTDIDFVYPVHLNPNVREAAHRLLSGRPNLCLIDPVPYPEIVALMKHAHIVLTDSGGIQEEAPSLGVPVLVMRDKTERPEAVDAGVARLVGTNSGSIEAAVSELLTDPIAHAAMRRPVNPYGDGRAAGRIVAALKGETPDPFDPHRGPSPGNDPG